MTYLKAFIAGFAFHAGVSPRLALAAVRRRVFAASPLKHDAGPAAQCTCNVKGLLFTVQKALPLLPDGASVILNASIVASKGFSSNSVYSATKAAVRSFARTWTTDLKDRRIRVNAVSPGATDTPGLSELLASSETGQQRAKMISNTVPLGRLGTPDEIAKAVVFLASGDSSYFTGTELFVDGGFAQV